MLKEGVLEGKEPPAGALQQKRVPKESRSPRWDSVCNEETPGDGIRIKSLRTRRVPEGMGYPRGTERGGGLRERRMLMGGGSGKGPSAGGAGGPWARDRNPHPGLDIGENSSWKRRSGPGTGTGGVPIPRGI